MGLALKYLELTDTLRKYKIESFKYHKLTLYKGLKKSKEVYKLNLKFTKALKAWFQAKMSF